MTDVPLRRPNGPIESLRAKLAWLWSPSEAKKRWDYRTPEERAFEKRVLMQDFEVVLLPRLGEEPQHLMVCIASETEEIGPARMPANYVHETSVDGFLKRAGRTGVTIEGAFYPHSRIDYINRGPLRVVAEGSPGA